MICKQCNGSGKTYNPGYGEENCCRCHGTGEIKQTNEERLKQANKEDMEHALTMLIMKDRFFADKEFAYVNIRFCVHCWLKEVHRESE